MSVITHEAVPNTAAPTDLGGSEAPATGWRLKGQLVPGGPMQRVPVARRPFVVGRSDDVSLTLAHPTVSSRHSELFEIGGTLMLRDLESRNGTFLNGHAVHTPQPLRGGDIVQFADLAFLVEQPVIATQAERSTTMGGSTIAASVQDQALAVMQFEKLLAHDSKAIVPHYQPIVSMGTRQIAGYELLGRSRLAGLESPGQMFEVAARFEQEVELSQMLRELGTRSARLLPETTPLFVNTHPLEVGSQRLLDSLTVLRDLADDRPIVLEIHEAAVADPIRLPELKATLDNLGIGLAYDDFGAGQTRLRELVDVRPDFLKFDMGLIRGLDAADDSKRHTIGSLVAIARDLGVTPLAEGVETEGEHEACVALGFELGQGYLYGRPSPKGH